MDWLLIVTFALLGGLVGSILMKLIFPTKPIGTLRIDTSDPDGPLMFLEVNKGVGDFMKEDYVMFKVDTKGYISQE